jgi:hypothetical protein
LRVGGVDKVVHYLPMSARQFLRTPKEAGYFLADNQ